MKEATKRSNETRRGACLGVEAGRVQDDERAGGVQRAVLQRQLQAVAARGHELAHGELRLA
jgi:hypothetical protein